MSNQVRVSDVIENILKTKHILVSSNEEGKEIIMEPQLFIKVSTRFVVKTKEPVMEIVFDNLSAAVDEYNKL